MQKEDEEIEYFIKACSFVCLPIPIPFSLPDDMIRMRPISATPLAPGACLALNVSISEDK